MIDKQISSTLGISVNTLRIYWHHIRAKVGDLPRSALAAAYVSGRTFQKPINEPGFEPDWEIDLVRNRVRWLSSQEAPTRFLDGGTLEDVVGTFVDDDQARIRDLIRQIFDGKLDACVVTGKMQGPDGPFLASAYVQIQRAVDGTALKLLGKRVPFVGSSLPEGTDLDHDWEYDISSDGAVWISGREHQCQMVKGQVYSWQEFLEMYHPNDRERLQSLVNAAQAGYLESFAYAGLLVSESGLIPNANFVQLVRDQDGRPHKLIGKNTPAFDLHGTGPMAAGILSITESGDLTADQFARKLFGIPLTLDTDLIDALANQIDADDRLSFRAFFQGLHRNPAKRSGQTYHLRPGASGFDWVRLDAPATVMPTSAKVEIQVIGFR